MLFEAGLAFALFALADGDELLPTLELEERDARLKFGNNARALDAKQQHSLYGNSASNLT